MAIANVLLSNSSIFKDVQILVIDNDQDSRDLYAGLLENSVAKVTTLGSIKAAIDFLNDCIPAIVICEMSFLNECVCPLPQQVKDLALSSDRIIPAGIG